MVAIWVVATLVPGMVDAAVQVVLKEVAEEFVVQAGEGVLMGLVVIEAFAVEEIVVVAVVVLLLVLDAVIVLVIVRLDMPAAYPALPSKPVAQILYQENHAVFLAHVDMVVWGGT